LRRQRWYLETEEFCEQEMAAAGPTRTAAAAANKQNSSENATNKKILTAGRQRGVTCLAEARGRQGGSRGARQREGGQRNRDAQKGAEAESRRLQRERQLKKKIAELEAQIAERERLMKELEASMSQPGFYDDRDAAKPVLDRHQALMWEVGDLMHQWEEVSHSAERLTKS
jgi:hypothetical protein